jgi:hypothetical protein
MWGWSQLHLGGEKETLVSEFSPGWSWFFGYRSFSLSIGIYWNDVIDDWDAFSHKCDA